MTEIKNKMGLIHDSEQEYIDREMSKLNQEQKDLYLHRAGIYALYRKDTGEYLYIGHSTNLMLRWISHRCNAHVKDAREYNAILYQRMRETEACGIPMAFTVLEYCDGMTKEEISEREDEWLRHNRTPFNYTFPAFDKELGYYQRPSRHVTK